MKAIKSSEKFLEAAAIPCIFVKAKFNVDAEGQRSVRMDFEAPMRVCYKHVPENMQVAYDGMSNAGAVKTDFAMEFPSRMIEIYLDPEKKPALVINCAPISKVQFRRADTEHEMKVRFSVTQPANEIGHWVVDHFGDPMFVQVISIQGEFPK